MHKLLFAPFFVLAMTTCAIAAPPKCAVPGEAVHWAADYCMYSAATDDFANPKVQACFAKQPSFTKASECKAKLNYKRGICDVVVRNGSYKKSAKQCLQDHSFSGPTVRNGGL